MNNNNTFLPPGGGYRNLRVYKLTEVIHDLTMFFVNKYVERGSRNKDQMVQAARSGKQNIAEGSKASVTSKEMEIKLTNVARASLEELMIDYEDYLRHHSLPLWNKSYPRLAKLRAFLKTNEFMASPMRYAERMNPEEFCNLCITLINQATFLLRRLLERQQEQFLQEGGIKERMYQARIDYRNRTGRTGQTGQKGPIDN